MLHRPELFEVYRGGVLLEAEVGGTGRQVVKWSCSCCEVEVIVRREVPAKNTASGYVWSTMAPQALAYHMNSTRHRLMGKGPHEAEREAQRVLAEWQDAQPEETQADRLYVEGDLTVKCRGRSRACFKLEIQMVTTKGWACILSQHVHGRSHKG